MNKCDYCDKGSNADSQAVCLQTARDHELEQQLKQSARREHQLQNEIILVRDSYSELLKTNAVLKEQLTKMKQKQEELPHMSTQPKESESKCSLHRPIPYIRIFSDNEQCKLFVVLVVFFDQPGNRYHDCLS